MKLIKNDCSVTLFVKPSSSIVKMIKLRSIWPFKIFLNEENEKAVVVSVYSFFILLFLKVAQNADLLNRDLNSFIRYALTCLIVAILLCVLIPQKKVDTLNNFFWKHKNSIVIGVFFAYSSFFVVLTLARHFTFYSHHFDLSAMAQTLYHSIHGRLLEHTWEDGINRVRAVSGTWETMLVILSPLLLVWKNSAVLVVVQSIAIGSGVIPVALFLKEKAQFSGFLFLTGCLFFLFFSPIHFVNLYDFHPYGMAIPGFLWAFYAMETNRWRLFYCAWIYILLCRSDLAVVGLSVGLYLLVFKSQFRHGLITLVFNLVFFIVLKEFVSPSMEKLPHHLYTFAHYGAVGTNTWEIAQTLIFNPTKVINLMLESKKIEHFLSIIILSGGLCFVNLKFFFIISPLLIVWYIPYEELSAIQYHHHAAMDTIIIFSTLLAVISMTTRGFFARHSTLKYLPIFYLFISGLGGLLGTPLHCTMFHEAKDYIKRYHQIREHLPSLHQAIAMIPKEARVNAQSDISPHVAMRDYLYLFPRFIEKSDYIIFDLHPLATKFPISESSLIDETIKLVKDTTNWKVLFFSDGVLLLERNTLSTATPNESDHLENIRMFLKTTLNYNTDATL